MFYMCTVRIYLNVHAFLALSGCAFQLLQAVAIPGTVNEYVRATCGMKKLKVWHVVLVHEYMNALRQCFVYVYIGYLYNICTHCHTIMMFIYICIHYIQGISPVCLQGANSRVVSFHLMMYSYIWSYSNIISFLAWCFPCDCVFLCSLRVRDAIGPHKPIWIKGISQGIYSTEEQSRCWEMLIGTIWVKTDSNGFNHPSLQHRPHSLTKCHPISCYVVVIGVEDANTMHMVIHLSSSQPCSCSTKAFMDFLRMFLDCSDAEAFFFTAGPTFGMSCVYAQIQFWFASPLLANGLWWLVVTSSC